jgi:hypothetical protein
MVNCHLNNDWLIEKGFSQWSNKQIINWRKNHKNKFDLVCDQFKSICYEVRELIGNSNFKGYENDLLEFYNHPSAETAEGNQLRIKLKGFSKICIYEAFKIGISKDLWLDKCWEIEDFKTEEDLLATPLTLTSSANASILVPIKLPTFAYAE